MRRCWALGEAALRATQSSHSQPPLTRQPVPCGPGKLRACECGVVCFELSKLLLALRGSTVPLLNGLKGNSSSVWDMAATHIGLHTSLGHGCDSDRSTHLWACGPSSEALSWRLSAKSPSGTWRKGEGKGERRERAGASSGPFSWSWEALTGSRVDAVVTALLCCVRALPCRRNAWQ